MVKNLPANAEAPGDTSSIPGLGRRPGGGNGNPLQGSCLENPVDRGVWQATVRGVTESQTHLSTHRHSCFTMFVAQQSESAVFTYIPFFGFPSHLGQHRALSRVLCATQ